MKKTVLTSIAAIAMCMPAMADNEQPNIAVGTNPASCTESVLETTSGTSNLQATWTANTINIEWYGADGKINPANSTANSCTYDDAITVPSTNPNKTGYTFAGWTVKAVVAPLQQCSLIDLNANISRTSYAYTRMNGESGSGESTYGLTPGSGEWAVEFSYGIVKGVASCNNDDSGVLQRDKCQFDRQNLNWTWGQYESCLYNSSAVKKSGDAFEQGVSGRYCWCKTTFYTPNNENMCQTTDAQWGSISSPYQNETACANGCAELCAGSFSSESNFRKLLFGQQI